jgi:3-methyladenine DNA glycosylase AlkD
MNLNVKWTSELYEKFIKYLKSFEDFEYKKFNSKIINDQTVEYIGVRTPILRKIAKEIAKNDYSGFLKFNNHKFYEEKAIHGFIIGYAKLDFDELMKMLKDFIPYISSWALTDTVAKKFPQIMQNLDAAFEEISKFTKSENPWEIRFGLMLLFSMYVTPEYINQVLKICESINLNHKCCKNGEIPYYVKMGNAWLVSECFIKFPEITEPFLKSKILEKWTQNKAIQKIKESFKVSRFQHFRP